MFRFELFHKTFVVRHKSINGIVKLTKINDTGAGISVSFDGSFDFMRHKRFYLGSQILVFQSLAATCIDGNTVFVHNVVVFHKLLTDIKVVAFYLFLGAFNRFGNHRILDRCILIQPQRSHQSGNTLTAKDTHEVVIERNIKLARSWVALAAGAPTQLVVDAARFMALGTNNMQSAELIYPLAKHNVGTAASYVGSECYNAFLAGASNHRGFGLVVFGIQSFMRHFELS